ncbi:MAG: methyltransferase domain-containing protein [Acidobacteria bacterium]|nr:methyltransferase domain-containing protein [Acidobacteriota bacterium]
MQITWDAALYDSKHAFVWRYGAELIELLDPKPGERILDLGCGTGHLTYRLAESGARVIGLDRSLAMLSEARRNYPDMQLVAADATRIAFARPFDAVFSNAALHWILDAERAVGFIASCLRPGGRFVAEFGGKGNLRVLQSGFGDALATVGYPEGRHWNPRYFPSIAEYSSLLERHGLAVRSAWLFDRPTPLEGAEEGMRNWIRQFESERLERIAPEKITALMEETERRLRPHLFRNGQWFADYVRLRLVALRQ